MSVELEIREVRLLGEASEWHWRFRRGLNLIVGPVGTGKTTLLNLVRFGLGGSWTPTKKARESAYGVRLSLAIDDVDLTIQRDFGQVVATAIVDGGAPETLRLARRPRHDDRTLSDLLLDLLGIPRIRVPTSRSRPGKQQTTISFQDVMTYLYLEQSEIDRSTARSDDKVLGPKRLYVFELLYGLIDEHSALLRLQEGQRADETKRLRRERKLLQEWASAYREVLSKAFESATSSQVLSTLDSRVREVDQRLLDRELSDEPLRDELALLEEQVNATQSELAERQFELDRLRDVQAQLELDLERMTRGAEAALRFQAFEYAICPRCLQDLEANHAATHCRLCGQQDAQEPSPIAIASERTRRAEQLDEASQLAQEVAAESTAIAMTLEQLQTARASLRERLELQGSAHRELLDLRTVLLVERAEARTAAALARDIPKPEFMVEDLDRRLAEIASDRQRIADATSKHERSTAHRRGELSELSAIFREILQVLDLPWFEGRAVVDPDTYLPLVDEQTLPELSSGGMKATVNLAYYLSNLVFSLREPTALMPRFLMIDGLRKDFGAGAKDLARADTIYRFLLTQQAAMAGPPARPFQMIVVDNDLPAGVASQVHKIELDYDTPLISDESEDASMRA